MFLAILFIIVFLFQLVFCIFVKNKNMHRNDYLTDKDINFLISYGFERDDNKFSGYYYYPDDKDFVLIPYEDGTYKFEILEYYFGDDGYEEDFTKDFSEKNESLIKFVNRIIGDKTNEIRLKKLNRIIYER